MKFLKVFCDGGSRGNPGPAATGFAVFDDQGHLLHQAGHYLGKTTNNVAEYTAVIHALQWLSQHSFSPPPQTCHFYLDSRLVVNQLNGLFKIKNSRLRQLVIQTRQLENLLSFPVHYHHLPRSQNRLADSLVNQALDQHRPSSF